MSLLKVTTPDLDPRDLGGDRQHRHPASLRLEQPIDQVQVPGTATSHADRQLPGHGRFSRRRKSSGLLMADVLSRERSVTPKRIGEAIQRVARHAIDALDARGPQSRNGNIGNGGHSPLPFASLSVALQPTSLAHSSVLGQALIV
jgi:hypothetical protein